MTTTALLEKKSLILCFDGGVVDGKQRTINRTFNNINDQATDAKLYSTANLLASVQERDLLEVNKREISSIHQQ